MTGNFFLLGLLYNVAAKVNVGRDIVGLVVHFESGRNGHEREWGWRSNYYDHTDGILNYFFRLNKYSEEQVISAERTKWLVHNCENDYVCFESVEYQQGKGMQFRNWFLRSGYSSGASEPLVMLQLNYYPQGSDDYRWKVECNTNEMKLCKVSSKRLSDDAMTTQWINGHMHEMHVPDGWWITMEPYKGTSSSTHMRIYAPKPTDREVKIYEGTNNGDRQTNPYKKQITFGMEQSSSTTETITESTQLEVGASFKKFSAGAQQTISSQWSYTSSKTFSASTTTTYTFRIPPHTHMIVTQLLGNYGNVFNVYDENYVYHYEHLETGERTTSKPMNARWGKKECGEESGEEDCKEKNDL